MEGKLHVKVSGLQLQHGIFLDCPKLAWSAMVVSVQAMASMQGSPRSSTGSSILLLELWIPIVMSRFHTNQVYLTFKAFLEGGADFKFIFCCEAQGKGRAKGRPRKVTKRSFIDMDGGWWLSFP